MISLDYVECLVTRPRGSWRWQDAFAVSYYRLQPDARGRLLWRHTGRSRKFWRWQDAFAVSYYRLQPDAKGRLLWRHTGRSRKFSKPQMTRARQSGWLTWDRASVPERPHNSTLENHPASPYNQDN